MAPGTSSRAERAWTWPGFAGTTRTARRSSRSTGFTTGWCSRAIGTKPSTRSSSSPTTPTTGSSTRAWTSRSRSGRGMCRCWPATRGDGSTWTGRGSRTTLRPSSSRGRSPTTAGLAPGAASRRAACPTPRRPATRRGRSTSSGRAAPAGCREPHGREHVHPPVGTLVGADLHHAPGPGPGVRPALGRPVERPKGAEPACDAVPVRLRDTGRGPDQGPSLLVWNVRLLREFRIPPGRLQLGIALFNATNNGADQQFLDGGNVITSANYAMKGGTWQGQNRQAPRIGQVSVRYLLLAPLLAHRRCRRPSPATSSPSTHFACECRRQSSATHAMPLRFDRRETVLRGVARGLLGVRGRQAAREFLCRGEDAGGRPSPPAWIGSAHGMSG